MPIVGCDCTCLRGRVDELIQRLPALDFNFAETTEM